MFHLLAAGEEPALQVDEHLPVLSVPPFPPPNDTFDDPSTSQRDDQSGNRATLQCVLQRAVLAALQPGGHFAAGGGGEESVYRRVCMQCRVSQIGLCARKARNAARDEFITDYL